MNSPRGNVGKKLYFSSQNKKKLIHKPVKQSNDSKNNPYEDVELNFNNGETGASRQNLTSEELKELEDKRAASQMRFQEMSTKTKSIELEVKDLQMLKVLGSPPKAVAVVCAIVNTIFGEKFDQKDTWKTSQKFMHNPRQAIERM